MDDAADLLRAALQTDYLVQRLARGAGEGSEVGADPVHRVAAVRRHAGGGQGFTPFATQAFGQRQQALLRSGERLPVRAQGDEQAFHFRRLARRLCVPLSGLRLCGLPGRDLPAQAGVLRFELADSPFEPAHLLPTTEKRHRRPPFSRICPKVPWRPAATIAKRRLGYTERPTNGQVCVLPQCKKTGPRRSRRDAVCWRGCVACNGLQHPVTKMPCRVGRLPR